VNLRESLQQQTATGKVLEVISRAAFDLQAVFETVVESSVRLCGADRAIMPYVLNGGNTVRSLSASFLADLEEDWRLHGKKIFPILREKFPQAYFNGLVALSRIIRWESESETAFDRTLSPEQVMDRLEERVGPEGRKLFERFIKQVNVLQAKQLAEREEEEVE
jgi:hypothetical protein